MDLLDKTYTDFSPTRSTKTFNQESCFYHCNSSVLQLVLYWFNMVSSQDSDPFTFEYVGSAQVFGIAIALPVVCSATVALRFYCRSRQKAHIGYDDWSILLGLVRNLKLGIVVESNLLCLDMFYCDVFYFDIRPVSSHTKRMYELMTQ